MVLRDPAKWYCRQVLGLALRDEEVEADAEALAQAVRGANVAALFYTHAWFCTGPALPLPQVAQIAHEAGVPTSPYRLSSANV